MKEILHCTELGFKLRVGEEKSMKIGKFRVIIEVESHEIRLATLVPPDFH
jgi:mRNA-degrading endonuclease RelE of RelBE toxin-antitoxin system